MIQTIITKTSPNTILTEDHNAYAFVRSADIREGKRGNYITGTLYDGESEIDFKVWDIKDSIDEILKSGKCIKMIDAKMGVYKDNLQLTINSVVEMNELEIINSNIIPSSNFTTDELHGMYENLIKLLDDTMLKVVNKIMDSKWGNLIRIIAGGKSMHHATKNGLWEHSIKTAEIAFNIANSQGYGNIDVPLVVGAALLHDIGKVMEFTTTEHGLVEEYTKNGGLMGHLFMGAMVIKDVAMKHLDKDRANHLIHIILSHHNDPEMGAVKSPATKEAFIVAQADMIDACLNSMHKDLSATEEDKTYSKFLGRYIFKN